MYEDEKNKLEQMKIEQQREADDIRKLKEETENDRQGLEKMAEVLQKEREDIVNLSEDIRRKNEIMDEMTVANVSTLADLQREKYNLEQMRVNISKQTDDIECGRTDCFCTSGMVEKSVSLFSTT